MATAAAQLDEIIASAFDNVKATLADQITTELPLLAALNSKGSVTEDGGKRIVKNVMYALNDTVGSYDGYDLIDTTPQDGFGQAVYEWKQYAGSVTVDGRTERLNAGSPRIFDILAAKFDQLRVSMEEDLNAMLWSTGAGNGGKDFSGLAAIVSASDPSVGALGGLEVATETWWKSRVDTAMDLTTIDGVRDLSTMYNGLRIAKSYPDFSFTTQTVYEAYEALAAPNIRFEGRAKADLGFESIAFRGSDVMFDNDATSGCWYFVNSKHLEFVKHRDAWLKMLPFARPVNQDAKTALVISMGELVTDVRRAHGLISGITTS
jgi:hypothetical protein